eukprot:GHRR01016960.1.p1 GENE.GHRR01016960.1~~GHRR01016960.1.p1  ORF type:complete len:206 (+),score=88.36 GHRR01016960.1:253-870(+)
MVPSMCANRAADLPTVDCHLLQAHLPSGSNQLALMRLQELSCQLSHLGLASGLWGAVMLGCRPSSEWLQHWWSLSTPLLPLANTGEVNMLLFAATRLWQAPPQQWVQGVCARISLLAPGMSANNMAAAVSLLCQLQKLLPNSAESGSVRELLAVLAVRVDKLEADRKGSHALSKCQQQLAQHKQQSKAVHAADAAEPAQQSAAGI